MKAHGVFTERSSQEQEREQEQEQEQRPAGDDDGLITPQLIAWLQEGRSPKQAHAQAEAMVEAYRAGGWRIQTAEHLFQQRERVLAGASEVSWNIERDRPARDSDAVRYMTSSQEAGRP